MDGLGEGIRLPVWQRESQSESGQQPNKFLHLPQPQPGFSGTALKAECLGCERVNSLCLQYSWVQKELIQKILRI